MREKFIRTEMPGMIFDRARVIMNEGATRIPFTIADLEPLVTDV